MFDSRRAAAVRYLAMDREHIDAAIKRRKISHQQGAYMHTPRIPVLGGDRNINADIIKYLIDEYNYLAGQKGAPVLCMDALALENTSVDRMERFVARYFVDKHFNFMTARYVIIPVNTREGTHWEVMVVDLSTREIYTLDSLEESNTIVSYSAYAEPTSFNPTYRNHTTVHIIAQTFKAYPRGDEYRLDDAMKTTISKFVLVFNAYCSFMMKNYRNEDMMYADSDETGFKIYPKRYCEPQQGLNCGIYVMVMIVYVISYYTHYAKSFENGFKHAGSRITRAVIERYRPMFTGYVLKASLPQASSLSWSKIHMQLIYRIMNCITWEGVRTFSKGLLIVHTPHSKLTQAQRLEVDTRFTTAYKTLMSAKEYKNKFNSEVQMDFDDVLNIQYSVKDEEPITKADLDSNDNDGTVCVYVNRHKQFGIKIKHNLYPLAALRYFDKSLNLSELKVVEGYEFIGTL
jgi:hypothetical protein